MTVDSDVGLTRVVVVAPRRRLDLALPEQLVLAALLPALLSHAGEDVVDAAGERGGWVLRRADGTLLDVGRSAIAQGVRDGELLHLVTAHTDWPEPEYDDVVEAIAAGARQGGVLWDGGITRWVGVAATGALLGTALAVCLASGPGWTVPAWLCLGLAVASLGAGALLTHTTGDSMAGFALCAFGLPPAFTGGLLLLGGADPLSRLGAPHLLTGCVVLLVAALAGHLLASEHRWLFVATAVAATAGVGTATVALGPLDAVRTAAAVEAVLLVLLPAWPALAARLGRLPLPTLPRDAADLVRDEPAPAASLTFAAVARADVVLTGLLVGLSSVAASGLVVLSRSDGVAAPILVAVVGAGYLLRARLFPTLRHRLPLLVCGLTGMAALAAGYGGTLAGDPLWSVLALAGLAALALALAVRYRQGRPSVYLGRVGDVLEIVLVLSVVPVACGVLGLYAAMRGVAG